MESILAMGGNVLSGLLCMCSVPDYGDYYPAPVLPSKSITHDWASEELTLLEAQANKLRRTILRRKTNKESDAEAQIIRHYEKVLTNLEHQMAQLQDQHVSKETRVAWTF